MDVRDASPLQLAPHVPARRAGEKHDEVGDLAPSAVERLDEHVRALDRLRLEALAESHAVLLERADDERLGRKPERGPCGATLPGAAERKAVELDPDRDPVNVRRARTPAATTMSSISRCVTWTREKRSGWRASDACARSNSGKPGVPGRPWKYAIPSRCDDPVQSGSSAGEVARVEDGLVAREARQGGRPQPVPGAACDGRDVGRLVVERPAERIAEDEEPRVRGPAACPQAGRARPGRARGRAQGATGAHPSSTSR